MYHRHGENREIGVFDRKDANAWSAMGADLSVDLVIRVPVTAVQSAAGLRQVPSELISKIGQNSKQVLQSLS